MKTKLWIGGVFAGIVIILGGCESSSISNPPHGNGKSYDLSKYLFPKKSGKFIYQYYTAEKSEGASKFGKNEYQKDIQFDVVRDGNSIDIVDRDDENLSKAYTVSPSKIFVRETKEGLEYNFERDIKSKKNFVKESVVKQVQEPAGTTTITYECTAVDHINSKVINPNPKKYEDVLAIVCTKKYTIYATVHNKKFETVDKIIEENFYAKDTGLIKSTLTRCQYTKVDNSKKTEDGCKRSIYNIWAFLED